LIKPARRELYPLDLCKELICYPRFDPKEFESRLAELRRLGVQGIEGRGRSTISKYRVLGKGCVGIVVSALTTEGRVALKIRRLDADRTDLIREAELLRKANSVGVGPRLFSATKNFILMELVDGLSLYDWLMETEDKRALVEVIVDLLEQCFKLDSINLDHGELSNARKHVIVTPRNKPVILDFESASDRRRPSNLTSICSFLFLRRSMRSLLATKLGEVDRTELISSLKAYKAKPSRKAVEFILKVLASNLNF